jgi:predicted Zn-dependent protease
MAEAILDEGVKQTTAAAHSLTRPAQIILSVIANNPGPNSSNKNLRLEKLLHLERLMLEQNPTELIYLEIVDTLRRLGNYAEAATAIEQLIAKYPNAKSVRILTFLADYHRRAGHIEAAKSTLQAAMKLDVGDVESQLLFAEGLQQIGQIDDAIQILKKAIAKEPNNPLYELTLVDFLSKLGRDDEAIKVLEGMLKRHADNDQILSFIRQKLSVIYVNKGDYAKGEAQLELLLERNPDDPGPNNDLGYLYAEQGKNLDKAEMMIRKALQEEPESFSYLDSLGWVLFKRGKLKEALEPMRKAAEQMKVYMEQKGSGPDATIYEHLGDIYFQLQQLEKASDAWREAAKAAATAVPVDKRLTEIRKKLETLEKLGPMPKPSSDRTP